MKNHVALILAAMAGCKGDDPGTDTGELLDTGWFTDTGAPVDPENCPDQIVSFSPQDGDTSWYWRDRPQVFVGSDNRGAYSAFVQTTDGERLDTTLVWDEASGLSFTVDWEGQLAPETTYTLGLEDCAQSRRITFTTSEFGKPLEIPPDTLVGNTYLLDLLGATWVEPAALAGVLQQYFNTPVLLGISYASEDAIRLIGAPGKVDDFGVVTQSTSEPVWRFPPVDFAPPFLDVTAPEITFLYQDGSTEIQVPVEDFALRTTISADGTRFGGGELSGLADSRYLGSQLLGGDPGDLCELAVSLGVACLPCADGELYCLRLVASDLDAVLLPDLVITE